MSTTEDYARVSIDSRVCCQSTEAFDLSAHPSRWRFVDHSAQTNTLEPVYVLELKFANTPPRWMVNIVRQLDLNRYSFSKYCYSISAINRRPTLRGASVRWR
jgi:hypothetical protein